MSSADVTGVSERDKGRYKMIETVRERQNNVSEDLKPRLCRARGGGFSCGIEAIHDMTFCETGCVYLCAIMCSLSQLSCLITIEMEVW